MLVALGIAFGYALLKEELKYKIATGITFLGYLLLFVALAAKLEIPMIAIAGVALVTSGLLLFFVIYVFQTRRTPVAFLVAFCAIIPQLFRMMHWPGFGLLSLISGLAFVLFVVIQFTKTERSTPGRSGDIAFGLINLLNFSQLASYWLIS
jgi:hypothetical protein